MSDARDAVREKEGDLLLTVLEYEQKLGISKRIKRKAKNTAWSILQKHLAANHTLDHHHRLPSNFPCVA
jgi:hypothetical protein